MLQYKVDFDQLEWETPIEGVRCKIAKYGNKQLRLIEYNKQMPPHWCAKGHYGLILKGEFEIEFKSGMERYKAGDGLFIPDGEKHRHRARVITEPVKAIFVEDL